MPPNDCVKLMARTARFVIALILSTGLIGYGVYAATEAAPQEEAKPVPHTHDHPPEVSPAASATRLWVCPMHPHIVQDHTGSCPICGMDLVAADEGNRPVDAGIRVDTATTQKMGVRLARVQEQPLRLEIRTVGETRADQTAVLNIAPKTDGWINKSNISYVGQRVTKGDVLYELYSPDLIQRQREYIELLARRDQLLQSMTNVAGQNAQVLASLARERIRLREKFLYADVSRPILDRIETTRRTVDAIPVHAPQSGYVSRINVRNGDYISPATTLFSIADPTRLWVDIPLYPDQLAWVKAGDGVQIKAQTGAGRTLRGTLEFVSPETDPANQTRLARVSLDNRNESLSPGVFVDVVIVTAPRTVLALPRSAILHTGRGDRVMLSRGDGHFLPTPVVTGLAADELIEISDGLLEGAEVAANGQFLLEAASSLNDTLQRMQSAD